MVRVHIDLGLHLGSWASLGTLGFAWDLGFKWGLRVRVGQWLALGWVHGYGSPQTGALPSNGPLWVRVRDFGQLCLTLGLSLEPGPEGVTWVTLESQ